MMSCWPNQIRDHSRYYMLSQWETMLHCNTLSLAQHIPKMIPGNYSKLLTRFCEITGHHWWNDLSSTLFRLAYPNAGIYHSYHCKTPIRLWTKLRKFILFGKWHLQKYCQQTLLYCFHCHFSVCMRQEFDWKYWNRYLKGYNILLMHWSYVFLALIHRYES